LTTRKKNQLCSTGAGTKFSGTVLTADFDLMRERHPGQLKARLRPKTQEDDIRISNCTGARTQGFAAPAGRAISGIISDQDAMMPVLLELMKYSDESIRFMSARGGLHHWRASDYY